MFDIMERQYVEVAGRNVEIEITCHPTVIGAYDPIEDVIILNKRLLGNQKLLKYVLDHEKLHARYPKGISKHTWIDIKDICLRPMKIRKQIRKLVKFRKYWRTILANYLLTGFFALIIAGPVIGIIWFIKNVLVI